MFKIHRNKLWLLHKMTCFPQHAIMKFHVYHKNKSELQTATAKSIYSRPEKTFIGKYTIGGIRSNHWFVELILIRPIFSSFNNIPQLIDNDDFDIYFRIINEIISQFYECVV